MAHPTQKLSAADTRSLLDLLKQRFDKNSARHPGIAWEPIQQKLAASPAKLWSLHRMEESGGEPDLVAFDPKTGIHTFFDCSAESPAGRRSLCYDRAAWEARKENKPKHNALDLAHEMGVTLLTEAQYRFLQQLGKFDCKTSSWVLTPAPIRQLGGAVFCDRRYDTVFLYHNGADSYYAARGFRACLTL